MSFARPVFCTSRPLPPRIRASDVKRAIQHAKNIYCNFEDTPECRVAWDTVEELSAALSNQTKDGPRHNGRLKDGDAE